MEQPKTNNINNRLNLYHLFLVVMFLLYVSSFSLVWYPLWTFMNWCRTRTTLARQIDEVPPHTNRCITCFGFCLVYGFLRWQMILLTRVQCNVCVCVCVSVLEKPRSHTILEKSIFHWTDEPETGAIASHNSSTWNYCLFPFVIIIYYAILYKLVYISRKSMIVYVGFDVFVLVSRLFFLFTPELLFWFKFSEFSWEPITIGFVLWHFKLSFIRFCVCFFHLLALLHYFYVWITLI